MKQHRFRPWWLAPFLALSVFAALGWGPCTPPSLEAACADPSDCRLWEAASLSGVRFGFHDEGGPGGADGELAALEGNAYTNHGVSWSSFQPTPSGVTSSMDAGCAFSRDNGLYQVGFHFAWDQSILDDLAGWVLAITDPDELRAVLRERARLIFDRCPDLDRISVLNEPLEFLNGSSVNQNHFYQVLGPDYIVELFQIVRAEAPEHVELFLNDYAVEYFPDRAAAYVDLVRELLEAGAPIDAVGLQTHLFLLPPFAPSEADFALYRRTLEELASFGVKVFVSELDVPMRPDEPNRFQKQAEIYRQVVETCLAVPACDTLIVWGIDDSHTWLDNFLLVGPGHDPLLFDPTLARKPAYFAVRDALLRGRGGDHPIGVDNFSVRRKEDRDTLSVRSRDAGVVAATPNSTNDPRDRNAAGANVELIRSDGTVESFQLAPGRGWAVRPSETSFFGRTSEGKWAWLRLREGSDLALMLWNSPVAPSEAAEGLRLRLTIGTLRVCMNLEGGTTTEDTTERFSLVEVPKAAGYDCSYDAS